jgi:hypothetical protein
MYLGHQLLSLRDLLVDLLELCGSGGAFRDPGVFLGF